MNYFSIILPVRNGGSLVKECIAGVLSQTYPFFNFIILDSGSTDDTISYIRSLNDSRIELFVSDKPLSIEENWHRIIDVKKNEFITLIGHDDVLDNNYLEVIDGLIKRHPAASLYQAHFRYIDSKGKTLRRCVPMDEVQKASEFLSFVLTNSIDSTGSGYMMRSKDFDQIGGIPLYPNLLFADYELWINLTLKNYKATAFEECFAYRLHQSTTVISTGARFQEAFGQFISYVEKLKKKDKLLEEVITRYGIQFIRFYCKGLSHRLLRMPVSKRNGESVASFLEKCKQYADRLVPENNFNPVDTFSVKLAKQLDSNAVTRAVFLAFKKMYAKPVLK